MDLDVVDAERGGPLVVRERGEVVELPAAVDLAWRSVARAALDPHFFATYVWPVDYPLTAWKLERVQAAWRKHNALGEPQGIARLLQMVERYGDEIEYDLRARMGVSFSEMWRQRRWRELAGFLQRLPGDTRLNEALSQDEEYMEEALKRRGLNDDGPRGPSMAEWSYTNQLLTILVDAVRANTEVTRAAAGGKGRNVPPMPRPTTVAEKIQNRLRRQEHEGMVAVLLPGRVNAGAGTMAGNPPSAE